MQCTYIGYWSTTGLSEMDWIIVDPFFLPSMEAHFTEGIWRLPRVAACYRGDPSLPESSWIPDPEGAIWLGSFNKYGKIREIRCVSGPRYFAHCPRRSSCWRIARLVRKRRINAF